MDKTLSRFHGERGQPTTRLTFLVDGNIIIGAISHPSRVEDALSEVLEEAAAQFDDPKDKATIRGYGFQEHDEHEEGGDFLTLSNVVMVSGLGQTLKMPAIRLREESISAWWPLTTDPDEDDDAGDDDAADDGKE